MLVIDASPALAWCFGDEKSPTPDKAIAQGAVIANAESKFSPSSRSIRSIRPRRTDTETDSHAWTDTFTLARSQGLTLYDAAYLELAMRHGAELATLDHDLAQAARRVGVPVLS